MQQKIGLKKRKNLNVDNHVIETNTVIGGLPVAVPNILLDGEHRTITADVSSCETNNIGLGNNNILEVTVDDI